jgi:hypothetical protein
MILRNAFLFLCEDYFALMNVSHKTLKILAALVWYTGPVILFSKGAALADGAQDLSPEGWSKTFSWLVGIVVGIIKTRYIFLRANRKNLARINALERPKIWEFYRIQFFFFLGLMILSGNLMSTYSQGYHGFMVFVAALDISIGTALLLSSYEFWKQGVFSFSKQAAQ